MSDLLFGRVVEVNVANNLLDGYEIDFEVTRTLEPEPNKCKIKIWNLEENLKTLVRQPGQQVQLTAGFPRTKGQLFLGDIRYAPSPLLNADFCTIIEAGDGESNYRDTTCKISWKKGKLVSAIVSDIIGTFANVGPGNFSRTFQSTVKDQFPAGGAKSGNAMRVLDELVRAYGYNLSIQDGQFLFTDAGTGANTAKTVSVISLGYDTGLLGEPELGETDKKTKKKRCTIKALLQPSLYPGSTFNVKSDTVNGNLVAQKITHQGSNWQNQFDTIIEVLL